ncbi:pyridoxine 4-dehydrogenase [Pseudohyphozyma bogoriensis]|nr:pyridoxine 4-dehydrogenase [Pseudohyphozyma bogoriensis]
MNHTWRPVNSSDEQAFEAFKAAIDGGATFFNTGEFYGQPEPTLGLQLLSRFFEAEPEYAKEIFLSVKGSVNMAEHRIDCSDENLRASVTNINRILKHRKMDMFLPARVDQTRPIEEVMKALKVLQDEGHFNYICLSEVSANTLRKAHAVAPITAIEMEYSLLTTYIEDNGVLDACKELGVNLIAYSPLSRGLLTGTLTGRADLPEGDLRRYFERFSEEHMGSNLAIATQLKHIAEKKGITVIQLCLAWLLAQWEGVIPIPGSSRAVGVKEGLSAGAISLSADELVEIRQVIQGSKVLGGRYNAQLEGDLDV